MYLPKQILFCRNTKVSLKMCGLGCTKFFNVGKFLIGLIFLYSSHPPFSLLPASLFFHLLLFPVFYLCYYSQPQSTSRSRGPSDLVQHFAGRVHIGARALLDILLLIWFGYIARLSQCEGGGYLTFSKDFYLPLRRIEGGRGSQHPVLSFLNPSPSSLLAFLSISFFHFPYPPTPRFYPFSLPPFPVPLSNPWPYFRSSLLRTMHFFRLSLFTSFVNQISI
jgi:hypothetical protein